MTCFVPSPSATCTAQLIPCSVVAHNAALCAVVRIQTLLQPPPPPLYALCSEETLQELERHLAQLTSSYSLASLANVLHFYATHRLTLGKAAAQAACDRALALLQQQHQQQPAVQQGPSLGVLAKMLWAVAALGLNHPPLLCTLLPAAGAALAGHERARQQGSSLPASLLRQLVNLAAATGQLQAAGLLEPAGLSSPDALLPFWSLLMRGVGCAIDRGVQHREDGSTGGTGGGSLDVADARMLQQVAAQLNAGLGGRQRGTFWVPPAVQRILALAASPSPQHPQAVA